MSRAGGRLLPTPDSALLRGEWPRSGSLMMFSYWKVHLSDTGDCPQVIKDKRAFTPICKAPAKGEKETCCLLKGALCGVDGECCDNNSCLNLYGEPVGGSTSCQEPCCKTGAVCKPTDMCCGGSKVIIVSQHHISCWLGAKEVFTLTFSAENMLCNSLSLAWISQSSKRSLFL